jgi:hypothetical protein
MIEGGRLRNGRQADGTVPRCRDGTRERDDGPGEQGARARRRRHGRCCSGGAARRSRDRGPGSRTGATRVNVHCVPVEPDFDRPVAIRPEGLPRAAVQPLDRRRCRMTIRIAESRRDDRHAGSHGVEERLRARRPGPVVGDLQEIDRWQAPGEELGIDLLLDVSGKQESPPAHLAEEDDRDVIDRGAAIGGPEWHAPRVGP